MNCYSGAKAQLALDATGKHKINYPSAILSGNDTGEGLHFSEWEIYHPLVP